MSIRQLAEGLYISPQPDENTAREAAALGIRSIICNRPDGEEDGQPDFAAVSRWFAREGITQNAHQPVTASTAGMADAEEFRTLLAANPTPVLAFCRTGTRSALLWALAQMPQGTTPAQAVEAAARAGIDLKPFEARLQAAAAQ